MKNAITPYKLSTQRVDAWKPPFAADLSVALLVASDPVPPYTVWP